MAYEIPGQTITLPFADTSTGIRQFRAVVLKSSGLVLPKASTLGQSITGVLISEGTTGSTDTTGKVGTVQISGVAKMEAEASTVSAGDLVSASSVGRVQSSSNAGDFVIGRVLSGSSGSANRILSVHLSPLGSTAAAT